MCQLMELAEGVPELPRMFSYGRQPIDSTQSLLKYYNN